MAPSLATWGDRPVTPEARHDLTLWCASLWAKEGPGVLHVVWRPGFAVLTARMAQQAGWSVIAHLPWEGEHNSWSVREARTFRGVLAKTTSICVHAPVPGPIGIRAAMGHAAVSARVVLVYWSGIPKGETWEGLWHWSWTNRPVVVLRPGTAPQQLAGRALRRVLGPFLDLGGGSGFTGSLAPLSCEWPAPLYWQDRAWHSVHHAYLAARCGDPAVRKEIWAAVDTNSATKISHGITECAGWNQQRLAVMKQLQRIKFSDPALAIMLHNTAPEPLICRSDAYWGIVEGGGENWLGKVLTEIRDRKNLSSDIYVPTIFEDAFHSDQRSTWVGPTSHL